MTTANYGFGKKPSAGKAEDVAESTEKLDLTGIKRAAVTLDPERERAAVNRGEKLGFVDRGEGDAPVRRRRQPEPQGTVYIKGPKETLDWFIEYTNQRGHRSYWQTIAEFRDLIDRK